MSEDKPDLSIVENDEQEEFTEATTAELSEALGFSSDKSKQIETRVEALAGNKLKPVK